MSSNAGGSVLSRLVSDLKAIEGMEINMPPRARAMQNYWASSSREREHLVRIDADVCNFHWDQDTEHYTLTSIPSVELQCWHYPVLKRTPSGAWIDYFGKRRFINLRARKQWASETVERALECYIARKRRQINILQNMLVRAEYGMRAAEAEVRRATEVRDDGRPAEAGAGGREDLPEVALQPQTY